MPWEISILHCSAIKVLSASSDSTLSLRTKFSIAFWTLASTSATLPSQYTFCKATDSSSYARLVCSTSGFTAEGAMSLMMERVPVSTATVLCSCRREIVEKLSTATPVATSEDSNSAACEQTARVSCDSLQDVSARTKSDGLLLLGIKIQSWTAGCLLGIFLSKIIFSKYFPYDFNMTSVLGAYVFGTLGVYINTYILNWDWNLNVYWGCALSMLFLKIYGLNKQTDLKSFP